MHHYSIAHPLKHRESLEAMDRAYHWFQVCMRTEDLHGKDAGLQFTGIWEQMRLMVTTASKTTPSMQPEEVLLHVHWRYSVEQRLDALQARIARLEIPSNT